MTIREAINLARQLKQISPTNYPDALMLQFVNECEGKIQTEFLRISEIDCQRYTEDDLDKSLIVSPPHDKLYYTYLCAMIDFTNGEYNKYQNAIVIANSFMAEWAAWFNRTHRRDGREYQGVFLSAYGIAVKWGYQGTEEEWLASLKGDAPYIGDNGNWWVGDEDTGVAASGGGSGGALIQADWGENDARKPAFVKGKTHWVEVVSPGVVLIDEEVKFISRGATIPRLPDSEFLPGQESDLVEGTTYIVTWGGVEYKCVAKRNGYDECFIGNEYLVDEVNDTGEPFYIDSTSAVSYHIFKATSSVETISIKVQTKEVVIYHKLAPEFLPDGVPYAETAAVGQTVVVSEVDAEGKPTKWEARDAGAGGGANFLLTLSTNEADAQANSDAITAAIAEHKHVVLQRGDYPVKPGIVVESGKLDMNGARFYTVDYKSETPLVYLKGESPEICNGELEGSYDLADNEEGYSFFEKECLIRPEGVNNAYIHHMDLHNNWGYCIQPGEIWERILVDSATLKAGINDKKYTTEAIPIPDGYGFVAAGAGLGYDYITSVSPIIYEFYDDGGAKILQGSGIPRKRHMIPGGAVSVKITTHTNTDGINPYYVYFTNYEETLVVSDCNFHNFHSLGMANMPGPTTVTRCSFIEAGKPRSEVYGTFRGTTGGIDIEDIQTPELIMSDCWGRDCGKLLMFGGYKAVVTNCIGGSIGIYRGWQCDITNCNIPELYMLYNPCRVSTNGVHADMVNIAPELAKYVRGNISTNYLSGGVNISPCLDSFDRFTVKLANVTVDNQANLSGKLNGRIEGAGGTGFKIKGFSSEPGSRIEIDSTVLPAANGNYYGAFQVTGDTYGLVSNAPFFPNGWTIHDSVFNIGALMTAYGFADVTYSGGFKNCVFNLTGGAFFRLFAKSPAEPVELTFEGCTINNANYYLFNFVPFAGSKITFKNCTIADESKLFNGNTSGITIEFVSGGEGSVEIDASLTVEGRAADAKAVGEALAAKMPAATTAKVGQYFLVSAVDENGNVTAVEAADVPKNDSESGLPLIAEVTLTEEVNNGLTIDKNSDGGAFSIKREFYVEGEIVPATADPANLIFIALNGATLTENKNVNTTATTYFYAHFWQSAPQRWEGYLVTKAQRYQTPSAAGNAVGGVQFSNWMGHNAQPTVCTAFKIGAFKPFGVGTKVRLYGK